MLGNITIRREDLKVKELDRYRGFYCGVCNDLKKSCGEFARATLTYDMTFLAILLTSLYEPRSSMELKHCVFHPGQKMLCIRNEYTDYAADMSVIMVYHNLLDNWRDDRNQKSLFESRMIHRAYKKAAAKHEQKINALRTYLRKLHKIEKENSPDIDLAAGLTGEFFKEVFMFDEHDIWSRDLGMTGFYLGKFIYLLDAYEDLEEDAASGNYNPLITYQEREDFEYYVKDILMMMASGAARAFERLPIVEDAEILRNVIYSGIWNKYHTIHDKRENK